MSSKKETQHKHENLTTRVLQSATAAKTLTLSDQHATILLTVPPLNDQPKESVTDEPQQGILKLNLVPFHKSALAAPMPEETKDNSKEHSQNILGFLKQFHWRMTSESGAEYSFHEGYWNNNHENTIKPPAPATNTPSDLEPPAKKPKIQETTTEMVASPSAVVKVELIFPASERQIARFQPALGYKMVTETPEIYQETMLPYIQSVVDSGSVSWIQNIVHIRKEQERLLWNCEANSESPGWILNIDTKWRTHPDALTVPRKEWYQHASTSDLYCLGILRHDNIRSLRDLTGEHVPILQDMLDQGPKVIQEIYGVAKEQLRICVHYPPQFYHFHVHFMRLENEIGAQVEKAHLLADIIQNLQDDSEYYKKRTMYYKQIMKNV